MRTITALALILASGLATSATADTIKVGVIGPLSGPFSIFGQNFQWGIEAYQREAGTTVGDDTVEFVYRDLPGVDPAKARALAQELVVKDKVQYLAGAYFTPNAMAMTPILASAKTPLIVLNAATSSITEASPLVVRTSFTMWQNSVPAATAAKADGFEKVITIVSDYGPGIDAETAFGKTFTEAGGEIVESLRLPLSTNDFNPIMQRVKDSGADGIFVFLPGGPPTLGFMKSYLGNGLNDQGIKIISTGDVMTEPDLPAVGDVGLGVKTTYHYSTAHDSPENKAFLAAIDAVGGDLGETTMAAVAAYDGAKVIYDMIAATGGKRDPEAAVKAIEGEAWESPRGPVSIDAKTHHITQNVYLREMQKVDGKYQNTEIGVFEAQPDWGLVSK
ncbi:ABC transporter substrate-binding protein [Puniceibacterium sp. HSS470]|jgi:branched-chain amino acid transport system substrate-binding protein|nr:ABC transporter substrate-binding protein [Puniceibacterium sp. HSS470]|tara:strand:- start:35682 stop:36851 length:1170 start_codon:yes stop_codon:yes gene_type:complete